MNIKKRLQAIILLLLAISLLGSLAIRKSFGKYQSSFEKTKIANQISFLILQKKIFAEDYFISPSERAKQQWYIEEESIKDIIFNNQKLFNKSEEQEYIKALKNNLSDTENIFSQLIGQNNTEKQKRLTAELNIKAQENILLAAKLSEFNTQGTKQELRDLIILFSFGIALFLILTFGSFWLIWQGTKLLELQKAKDEAILGGIGDAVFAIDTDKKIILFNPVAQQLSGFAASEALGKPYSEVLKFTSEDGRLIKDEFIKTAFRGQKTTMTNHTVIINKNNESIPVGDSAAPIFGDNNKVVGVVVVFRDTTQERAIDRAKTEFVSLASHQLRTPLTSIRWYSEMLLAGDAGKLKSDQEKFIQNILEGNNRMVNLVNSLLNVSRVELGSFEVNPVPTKIVEIFESLLSELLPQIKSKSLVINKKYDESLKILNLDPQLIRIVLQNLLSNAVKYTPNEGRVDIIVNKLNKTFKITISDTGYGIPKSQQSKIFTKLFRADNAKQKVSEGNGLGLYLVKAIIEQSKGKVWFESEENKGTNFYIELPLSGMKPKTGSKALSN